MKQKQSSPSTQRLIIRVDKAITATAWRDMIKEVL
jgi:hypothetical protein